MKKVLKNIAIKVLGKAYNVLVLPKHWLVALAANLKRGFPARDLKVVAVTGTNGKTSTAFLIYSLLKEADYKVGLMTTVAYGFRDQIKSQIAHMTTQPAHITLDRIIEMKKAGMRYLVLEVTSQALAQYRIMGIPISIAVMTNVTHEHLDYHRTFKNYLKAKLKLFKKADRHRGGHRLGIVNIDDDNALTFIESVQNVSAYSLDTKAESVIAHPARLQLTSSGSSYDLKIDDDVYHIKCRLPGSFNVANSMAAALAGRALGLKARQIETGIQALESVEGRMTAVEAGQPFTVLIDFAHTPDSFEKLFADLRPLVKGKLIVMFGSAGRRDKIKRAVQGDLAGQQADYLVLTEEDDRDEDGGTILKQISQGAKKAGKQLDKDMFLIPQRRKAIKKALSLVSSPQDLVLLLGKGHEKTIERADGEHPWNEIAETRAAIKKMLAAQDKAALKKAKSKTTHQ